MRRRDRFTFHYYHLKDFYVQIRKIEQETPEDELILRYGGGMTVSSVDRSKPRKINRQNAALLGVVIIGVVFTLPVFPVTYHIPYREEVPIQELIVNTNVVVNSTGIPLEGGAHKFWHVQIDDYKVVDFSLESSETVDAAIMSLEEYEAFQDTLSVDQCIKIELDADSIDMEYQIPVTETYFFVVYNHHDGSQGTEDMYTIIDSVTITESWEEEVVNYVIEEGIRDETATVTLWQIITGSTPVF